MNSIISLLVMYNQLLLSQIHQLIIFIAKNIPLNHSKYDVKNPKYKKLTVDKLPLISKSNFIQKYCYKKLLKAFKTKHGKDLSPIKSRGGKTVPSNVSCPHCKAPHIYI